MFIPLSLRVGFMVVLKEPFLGWQSLFEKFVDWQQCTAVIPPCAFSVNIRLLHFCFTLLYFILLCVVC
jgi:hypothetical protein